MIILDTNLIYGSDYYVLNTKRVNKKSYSSIEEYPENYATENAPSSQNASDPQATNNSSNRVLDYNAILEALKFSIPQNRFAILLQLSDAELIKLLYYMDKKQLVLGLKFFDKEKLLSFIYNMSPEDLLKMLYHYFRPDQILETLPIQELGNLFDSKLIDYRLMMKVLENTPPEILTKILEGITGQAVQGLDPQGVFRQLQGYDKNRLAEGMKTLPYKEMLKLMNRFVKLEPKIMQEINPQFLVAPFEKMTKSSIVEAMIELDQDKIIKMLTNLPQNMLAMVVTMMDPNDLADILKSKYSDLLAQFAA